MLRARHLAVAFALLGPLVSAPRAAAAPEDELRLRVVSLNAWGLAVAPARAARMERLARELVGLEAWRGRCPRCS